MKRSIIAALLLAAAPAAPEKRDPCKEQLWWVQQGLSQLETTRKNRSHKSNKYDEAILDRFETLMQGEMTEHMARYLVCKDLK